MNLKIHFSKIEYDPNPLLTLGKRKRSKENSANESTNLDSTGPSTSGLQNNKDDKDAAHKERRRLKKLRRESKVKSTDLSPDANEKRHKHKHKCGEEFCKHRKHKKRRKHKKHHHRENDESPVEQQDEISQDDSVSQNGDVFMEDEQKEEKLEEDKFDPNLKEDTMTEEDVASSVTESSGSYYVSFLFVK